MSAEAFVAALDADDSLLKHLVGQYVDDVAALKDFRDMIQGQLDNRANYLAETNGGALRLMVRHLNIALHELERLID
jgi:hypothetical protein